MFGNKEEKRFTNYNAASGKPSKMMSNYIVVDEQTGVQYLFSAMGGMTVLVDKDGKPLLADGYK
ncbi:DUF6440 family protein [Macrococcus psychrotolerans]|uniref:DUF6440 family protein n=1 Tax=Macrococcus psychrotolerans TaxID=3039389 RepID=A0AAT9P9Q7_9STAP|nr:MULTISPECIES: DUF6440 family protein [Macrococcus]QYA33978.1 hypothetical protein KYI10_08165 [Macrococcus sp. 19Msa1099]QYA38782.1 hypothetical protein KYI07_08155 [Macrococcus caseolyticus]QYA77490.1 hypothetical protein KYI12_08155 [Macrococcus caseolyticus]